MSDFPELKFEGFDPRPLIPISALPFANSNSEEKEGFHPAINGRHLAALPHSWYIEQGTRLPFTIFSFNPTPRNINQSRQIPLGNANSGRVETREEQLGNRIDDYHLATQAMFGAYHFLRDQGNEEKIEYHHGERSIVDALFNLVQSLPETDNMEYKSVENLKAEKYDGETCTCSLCLEDITKDSDIYRLPCNHIFHAGNCISEQNITVWVRKHGTCPYCRATTDLPESIKDDDLDPDDILTVMDQASVSREDAIKSLKKHHNIIDAILEFDDN